MLGRDGKGLGIKTQIGRLIPYPLIAWGRRQLHRGPHRCEVCEARYRRRLDRGHGHAVLERLQVVGGMMRRDDMCPICHAGARERLVWTYLARHVLGSAQALRIAHFAPEKGIMQRLSRLPGVQYRAYDLAPARYRQGRVAQADIECLAMADASVDLLLANHVLEHVLSPARALAEVRRVLQPGTGLALLQVPLALGPTIHRDGGADMPPDRRIELFGHKGHLRLFTPSSYLATLREAGLEVEAWDAFAHDAAEATRLRLDPFERLYLVRRPG